MKERTELKERLADWGVKLLPPTKEDIKNRVVRASVTVKVVDIEIKTELKVDND